MRIQQNGNEAEQEWGTNNKGTIKAIDHGWK